MSTSTAAPFLLLREPLGRVLHPGGAERARPLGPHPCSPRRSGGKVLPSVHLRVAARLPHPPAELGSQSQSHCSCCTDTPGRGAAGVQMQAAL